MNIKLLGPKMRFNWVDTTTFDSTFMEYPEGTILENVKMKSVNNEKTHCVLEMDGKVVRNVHMSNFKILS